MKKNMRIKHNRNRLIAAFLALCLWVGLLPQAAFASAADSTVLHYNLFRLYQKSNTVITPLESITDFAMTTRQSEKEIAQAPEKTDYKHATATDPWMFDSSSGLKFSGFSGAYGFMYQETTPSTGGSLALKIKINKPAKYDFTAFLSKYHLSGIVDLYIAPETAANKTAEQYKVGSFDQYAPEGKHVWNHPVKFGDVDLKAGSYVITIVIAGRSSNVSPTLAARFAISGFQFKKVGEISSDLPHHDLVYDFTKIGAISPLNDLNIEKHGFAINKEQTSEYAIGLGDEGFRIQSYGLQSQVNSSNIIRQSDTAIDIHVPIAGAYTLSVSGGKYSSGGIAAVYVDGNYAGTYNFYGSGIADGQEVSMRSFSLTQGIHTVTFHSIGKSSGSADFCHYIGKIRLTAVNEVPTITEIETNELPNKLAIGESFEITAKALLSDGTTLPFEKKLDGTEDEYLKLKIISSAPNILEISNDATIIPHTEGTATITITATLGEHTQALKIPITVVDGEIHSLEAFFAPEKIIAGQNIAITLIAKLADGSIINQKNIQYTLSSSDNNIFSINGYTLHAKQNGTADLIVSALFAGKK